MEKMKCYDDQNRAQQSQVDIGDLVLCKWKKNSIRYNPALFEVVEKKGTIVTSL